MKMLSRFHEAQSSTYEQALEEIRCGCKRTHWMWYIFPQLRGLGTSYNANYYGINSIEEAIAYLKDPKLGAHLLEISQALLDLPNKDVTEIFGHPDDAKLKSCMTLFNKVDPDNEVYKAVLDKFFGGSFDNATLGLLGMTENPNKSETDAYQTSDQDLNYTMHSRFIAKNQNPC